MPFRFFLNSYKSVVQPCHPMHLFAFFPFLNSSKSLLFLIFSHTYLITMMAVWGGCDSGGKGRSVPRFPANLFSIYWEIYLTPSCLWCIRWSGSVCANVRQRAWIQKKVCVCVWDCVNDAWVKRHLPLNMFKVSNNEDWLFTTTLTALNSRFQKFFFLTLG